MRTMHSIGYALSQFDAEMVILAPEDMSPTEEFLAELDEKGTRWRIVDHIDEVIHEADVIYMEPSSSPDYTQSRHEVQDEYGLTPANYQITSEVMKRAKGDSIILHSLPRMDELFAGGGRFPSRPLLAGGLQRRRDAHGAPGPRARRGRVTHAARGCRDRREFR